MPHFIEFTTTSNSHNEFARGNPVHDGVIPAAKINVSGVRIDGKIIAFTDDSLPDRLHKSLVDGHELERRRHAFECNIFALLMLGTNLTAYRGRRDFSLEHSIDEHYSGNHLAPLALGAISRWARGVNYLHTVVPAHQLTENTYLHKLGDKGPVCLSSLDAAMGMFGCRQADPIIGIKVRAGRKLVTDWQLES